MKTIAILEILGIIITASGSILVFLQVVKLSNDQLKI